MSISKDLGSDHDELEASKKALRPLSEELSTAETDRVEVQRLRRMVEHLPAGAVYVAGNKVTLNRAVEKLTGYAREELTTLDEWFTTLYPTRQTDARQLYDTDYRDRFPAIRTVALTRKDGEERVVEFAAHRFDDHAVWLLHDVTDRDQVLEELREKEELLRAIVDTAGEAIISIDEHGAIQLFNRAAEQMFGFTLDEAEGQNVRLLMPEPYRSEHDQYMTRYRETGEKRIIGIGREVTAMRKDGTTFPIELDVAEIDHRGWFTGIIRDLTERRHLEDRLARVQADEREHLARELHDGLGGQITGLALLGHSLRSEAERIGSPLEGRLTGLIGLFDALHEQVRELSRGLNPVEAVPEGLMLALEDLASGCRHDHEVPCSFTCEPPVPVADSLIANELFRIAQEAVTNAVRHGNPTQITINLNTEDSVIALTVKNNGLPFQESDNHSGVGLISMRQRAAIIGGTLTVGSVPEGGTQVTVVMPRAEHAVTQGREADHS